MAAAPNPRARLLMLLQWRAGLRVSEAIAVERRDLSLGVDRPTLRVRRGKGYRARVVPVHPELETALAMYVDMLPRGHDGPLVDVSRQSAWQWVKQAAAVCQRAGQLAPGPEGQNPHPAPCLCPTPAAVRSAHQPPEPVAGSRQPRNHADLPGPAARPQRVAFGGSVMRAWTCPICGDLNCEGFCDD